MGSGVYSPATLSGVKFKILIYIAVPAVLSCIVSYPQPVELLQDHLLCMHVSV